MSAVLRCYDAGKGLADTEILWQFRGFYTIYCLLYLAYRVPHMLHLHINIYNGKGLCTLHPDNEMLTYTLTIRDVTSVIFCNWHVEQTCMGSPRSPSTQGKTCYVLQDSERPHMHPPTIFHSEIKSAKRRASSSVQICLRIHRSI